MGAPNRLGHRLSSPASGPHTAGSDPALITGHDTRAVRQLWNARSFSRHEGDRQLAVGDQDHMIGLLGLQGGARVLDAGCGTGHRLTALSAVGADVVAIDIAEAMVAYASLAAPGTVAQADLYYLPFKDGSFDAAVCVYVLDFVPDPVVALGELRRTVRADGRLLVTVAGATRGPRQASWRRFLGEPWHTIGPLPWELEPLLTHTGWQVAFQQGAFGTDRDGTPNPIADPTTVDTDVWKTGLQALADGWSFLAVAL